ncbi:MAG TPA: hypothetical protein DIV86_04075 [Alphaproteobacteria bacterium]|nr:hypothetical protein [Alphaproteobacteria bacterium]
MISSDNHYLAQSYLKRWSDAEGKVYLYRSLVSNPQVPLWARKSVKSLAYTQHLYTSKITAIENDELERWFGKYFESPAKEVVEKIVNEVRLFSSDWECLINFLAMHDVRTPARLLEHLYSATETYQKVINDALKNIPEKLKSKKDFNMDKVFYPMPHHIKVNIRKKNEISSTIEAKATIGRESWIWSIKNLLNKTSKVLHDHKWTILKPADGFDWFTSDKPVVKLNYYSNGNYDFKGGWGSEGTEIFFPLDPQNLLFTQVNGKNIPKKYSKCNTKMTKYIRRFIAESSYRYIFSNKLDEDIKLFKPREVNLELYNSEKDAWDKWNKLNHLPD